MEQPSKVEPTASSLVTHMFMGLRSMNHRSDSHLIITYQMLLLLLRLGHAGGPMS